MIKRLLFILTFFFPAFLFAQAQFTHCENVFTKVEHLPSLKIQNTIFQDTLSAALKSKKFPLKKNNEITYKFVVTKQSQIDDLRIDSGDVSKEIILREAILSLANLWAPAIQNGHEVCAYVKLKLQFVDSKINIEIMQ
jgi:hypothetical protein